MDDREGYRIRRGADFAGGGHAQRQGALPGFGKARRTLAPHRTRGEPAIAPRAHSGNPARSALRGSTFDASGVPLLLGGNHGPSFNPHAARISHSFGPRGASRWSRGWLDRRRARGRNCYRLAAHIAWTDDSAGGNGGSGGDWNHNER